MKIRNGFVSNSSSASFCCEICDRCWDADHAPAISGGLCNDCEGEYQFCNSCEELLPINSLFRTAAISIKRGRELGNDENVNCGDGYIDWKTSHTCIRCMPENPMLVEAWVRNGDFDQWQKKIANPDYKMTETDELLSKAVLGANK